MNLESGTTLVGRRDFVRSLIGLSAGLAFPRAFRESTLRVAVLEIANRTTRRYDSITRGIELGRAEAARAASLFSSWKLELVSLGDHRVTGRATGIATELANRGAQVILASLDDDDTLTVAGECDHAKVLFINCGARADSLRRSVCSQFMFHIEASDAMYTAARKLAPNAEIALWSSRLQRYGASQLNDRFKAAAGSPMTSKEWAGWFAMKVTWESLIRANSSDAGTLANYMSSDAAQYDGHKGAALSFRGWDHQLRQPLYAIGPGTTPVRDIPDIARSAMPARELLDTIGDSAAAGRCARS